MHLRIVTTAPQPGDQTHAPLQLKRGFLTIGQPAKSQLKGFFKICFYLFLFLLCWVFFAERGFSLVAASGGYSPAAVLRLLIAAASLVVEHRLQGMQASAVVVPRP